MKRILLFIFIISIFALLWKKFEIITIRVAGQPTSTGVIQTQFEEPFFNSLAMKSQLPIDIIYRPINETGFKDDYELRLMKENLIDLVSLRFIQNQTSAPVLAGMDIPGVSLNIYTSRLISKNFSPYVDEILQQDFNVKLLSTFSFGSQELFCKNPIYGIKELKGLKIRVGGDHLKSLLTEIGAITKVIDFQNTFTALENGDIDCAISSWASADSANWFKYLKFNAPIPLGIGINGYVIRLNIWNQLSSGERDRLQNSFDALSDAQWNYIIEEQQKRSMICNSENNKCQFSINTPQVIKWTKEDLQKIQNIALRTLMNNWFAECNIGHPNCEAEWNKKVAPYIGKEEITQGKL
jgi:TRAP-type transport system periplasmic protein